MKLVIIAAVLAVCGAAKLDRTYLPPATANTAGGSPGALQTPFSNSLNRGRGQPKGSFTNEFQGVVVDAAAAGTRSSDPDDSGLGAPRPAYGSMNSKVGSAAFRAPSNAGFRQTPDSNQAGLNNFDQETDGQFSDTNISEGVETPEESIDQGSIDQGFGQVPSTSQRFGGATPSLGFNQGSDDQDFGQANDAFGQETPQGFEPKLERAQATRDRSASTLRFVNEVGTDSYNWAFETDNGISAEESGVATNGVQAKGAYSYTGDDGQVYSVTYTADENGFRPQGAHLPTPPPIPVEILKALEQNARDEAAGLTDDGSYDAQKYNGVGDYSQSENANNQYNDRQSAQPENRPESDATASGTFTDANEQPLERPNGNNRPSNNNGFAPSYNQRPISTPNRFGSDKNDFVASPNALEENQSQESGVFEPASNGNDFAQPDKSPNGFNSNNGFISPSTGNVFNQASNGAGLNNEYLPPVRGRPNQGRRPQNNYQQFSQPQARPQFTQTTTEAPTETPDVDPTTEIPLVQQSNGFRRPANGRPTQGIRNGNSNGRFPTNRVQNRFGAPSQQVPSIPQRSSAFNSQRGTVPPQTELTTPFESQGFTRPSPQSGFGPQRATVQPQRELTTPIETVQETSSSDVDSEVEPTQASNFGRQPASRPQRPTRPYGGLSNNVQRRPIQPAQSQDQFNQSPQFGGRQPQSAQRPSNINQFSQQPQGEDDSYYYNQPSKPFGVPEQSSYSGQENGQNAPSPSFQSQNRRPSSGPRYPNPPAVAPTSPSESEMTTIAETQFNGITQASASPFAPEPTNINNRFGSRPQGNRQNLGRPTSGSRRPSQSFNNFQTQSQDNRGPSEVNSLDNVADARPSQQYNGEIYEYSKPAVTLPPPAKTGIAASLQNQEESEPKPEEVANNENQESEKPEESIPERNPAQTRPQGVNGQQRPLQSQNGFSQAQPQRESRPVLGSTIRKAQCCRANNFGSQPSPQSPGQGRPQAQRPFENQASFAGASAEQGGSSLAGKGEVFSGPRNPPSFDSETGYHY